MALEWKQLSEKIGKAIGRIHNSNIIHGDLTTSNLMLRLPSLSLVVVDFGLSYISSMAEDKAVDLYVLERAFLSTHPNSEPLVRLYFRFMNEFINVVQFADVLEAYRTSYKGAESVLKKLNEGE
jgi:TP53 regulating kinase-like protein